MDALQGLDRLRQEREAIAALESRRELLPGQLSPRARVLSLFDEGTFVEIGALGRSQMPRDPESADETATDGLIAGFGAIDGRMTAVIADDPLVQPLTDGAVAENKRMKLLAHALHGKMPIVYFAEAALIDGVSEINRRPEEGTLLGYYSDRTMTASSLEFSARESPIVSVAFGAIPIRQSTFVAESDFVIRVDTTTQESIFDAQASDDRAAIAVAREFLTRIPPLDGEPLARCENTQTQSHAAQWDDKTSDALTITDIVDGLFDPDRIAFHNSANADAEFQTGLGTIDCFPVLYVAAGTAEQGSSDNTARALTMQNIAAIVRVAALARRFHIPLLLIQNGATLDSEQLRRPEYARELARAITLIRDTEAPKFSLITRAGHALDDFILGGRELGTHYVAAWPWADVGIKPLPAYTAKAAHAQQGIGPWDAAGYGLIDDVITPAETRARLVYMLELLAPSRALPPEHADRDGRILTR